jgi:hypothetical protein
LCLAEGEGRNAVHLARQGFVATAVDSSNVGLIKAEKLAQEYGVTIETVPADLEEYIIDKILGTVLHPFHAICALT